MKQTLAAKRHSERSILQSLVDPVIRAQVCPHLRDWMFAGDREKAIFKVISAEKFQNAEIDIRAFVLDLRQHQLSAKQIIRAKQMILNAPDIRKRERERAAVMSSIEDFVREKLLTKAMRVFGQSPAKGRKLIVDSMNFSLVSEDFYDFSDIEQVKRAKERDLPPGGRIIKSSFDLVNNCSIYHGYKYGDLTMFAGKPGAGKSTAMVQEGYAALKQGFRVCHVFLGDMSDFDGFVKYAATATGRLAEDIAFGPEEFLKTKPKLRKKLKRLRVHAFPSENVDVHELLAKVDAIRQKFKFDLLIVDYDSNIKSPGDNLYTEGGLNYGALKGYGQLRRCAVIIGSQTKINYWDAEIVPMAGAAESSRKQQHIDYQLNIGVNPDCEFIGCLNMAKARRGKTGKIRVHFQYAYSRIAEIDEDKYNDLRAMKKRDGSTEETDLDFSDDEIADAESEETSDAELRAA